MKRKIKVSVIAIVLFCLLIVAARLTHFLSFYRVNDGAMLPSFDKGDLIAVSKLRHFSQGDVICCSPQVSRINYPENEIFVRRIAGMEGDTIEINDGYLIRNGIMADYPEKRMFNYFIYKNRVRNMDVFNNLKIKPYAKGDSVVFCMNYSEFKTLDRMFIFHRLVNPKTVAFNDQGRHGWNNNNFGPVVVPGGYCFVLADNRDNFTDSRHFGFIPLKNILATVLTKER